ncbi:MAG TPA: Holliday junction resolvase RuvX [Longimicrobiales bacterium]|nr:Holliday junction resolvase RuvX [Longimicrobiales bacterium]
MARILAVDYGERRIGVALSDPLRMIATPLPTLLRKRGKRPPVQAILDIVQANGVDALVVGLPLTLEGTESEWTLEVRAFGETLARRSGLPVTFVDERMSSVAAERAVRGLGLPKHERERKDRIDAAAAVLILQAHLDALRRDAQRNTEARTDETLDDEIN